VVPEGPVGMQPGGLRLSAPGSLQGCVKPRRCWRGAFHLSAFPGHLPSEKPRRYSLPALENCTCARLPHFCHALARTGRESSDSTFSFRNAQICYGLVLVLFSFFFNGGSINQRKNFCPETN